MEGKKVLVTGAGRGIGRELAMSIANAGGEVYALGRTKENIESLAEECCNIHPIVVDLRDWEATREELHKLEALDGVVNNADKSLSYSEALDVEKETLEEALDINVHAPVNVIQVTTKKMIEAGKPGSVVNVSSVASIRAARHTMDHSVSKACLDMVTKQFALELGPHRIRVNSVNPAWVMTSGARKELKKFPDRETIVTSITPMGRYSEIREVVDTIMYLLGEHSSMVSGTTLLVDGGLLSNIPV